MKPQTPFPIGFEFTIKRGRQSPQLHKVIDHLTTTNSAGEIVAFRYVTLHTFLGQSVIDRDVVHTTIQRCSFQGDEA